MPDPATRLRPVFCCPRPIIKGGAENMAKAGSRVKITLRCAECKQRNYVTNKNKKNTPTVWS